MKILIAEDEEVLAKVMKEKLEKAGFDVLVVSDGDQVVPAVERLRPEIVVLDLMLPKRTGFEILKELKLNVELKTIPVMVLSNLEQDEDIKKVLSLGAIDYLVKTQHPVNEVVERIKKHLITRK